MSQVIKSTIGKKMWQLRKERKEAKLMKAAEEKTLKINDLDFNDVNWSTFLKDAEKKAERLNEKYQGRNKWNAENRRIAAECGIGQSKKRN